MKQRRIDCLGNNTRKNAESPEELSNLLPPSPRGSVHAQMVRCGKTWCHCANGGPLHGPYYYLFYRECNRQHKVYVPLGAVSRVEAIIRQWKESHPSMSKLLADLKEVEVLERVLMQESDNEARQRPAKQRAS